MFGLIKCLVESGFQVSQHLFLIMPKTKKMLRIEKWLFFEMLLYTFQGLICFLCSTFSDEASSSFYMMCRAAFKVVGVSAALA